MVSNKIKHEGKKVGKNLAQPEARERQLFDLWKIPAPKRNAKAV